MNRANEDEVESDLDRSRVRGTPSSPRVAGEDRDRWREENRAGLEVFERFVQRNGLFNEDDREW